MVFLLNVFTDWAPSLFFQTIDYNFFATEFVTKLMSITSLIYANSQLLSTRDILFKEDLFPMAYEFHQHKKAAL